ncbi:AraC family transcriptional regulator [Nocardioides panzhihuensis]|uniref:AraC-like DNA-binding protein n=1 Tax=Nocardioides panzhihuensis TaxID=860243 RepID=A0A7Z0DS14_9ACTN|nr:AraC family transcriptional regulator [Nocardioides panzhihuensis]NYI80281.1 AraC-like DNA-binding protein [Nocardioides panzhihuensis]
MAGRMRAAPKDWGQASRVVAQAYFPHELRPVGGANEPRLTLRTLDLGPVLIGHVGWGADVAIECDYPGAYEVNLPITGHLESRGRFGALTSVVGQGTVFRADTPSLISHWDATCTVLGVKFDSTWLEVETERILGTDRVNARTVLPEQLSFEDRRGRAWRQLISSLGANLHDPDLFADSELVRRQLAGAVAAGLVDLCCPDGRVPAPAQPRTIRRVVEALHDDPARAWTAADMAALAGTSVRRLQEGFQQWVGSAPSHYLLDIRLQRAHADLLTSPTLSVAEVAATWGFSSASRFAAAHRRKYGSAPSDVLRQGGRTV